MKMIHCRAGKKIIPVKNECLIVNQPWNFITLVDSMDDSPVTSLGWSWVLLIIIDRRTGERRLDLAEVET